MRRLALTSTLLIVPLIACSDDGSTTTTPDPTLTNSDTTEDSGDGDPTVGDGDPGDGDGDPGDGDPGDGDGDPGDGDGDICDVGTQNCACDEDDSCDDGLNCVDGVCVPPSCGDGILDPGEECDVGNETMFCDGDCTYAVCGDGYWNQLSEECDDGNGDNNDACVGACVINECGDGFLWEGMEECDDADMVDNNDCRNDCLLPICGDGAIWDDGSGEEECDDGNMDETDACNGLCQNSYCGDGVIWQGMETCDDGNDDNSDACPGTCQPAVCGDGFVYANVEECDDGNQNEMDGCDSQCMWTNGPIYELTFQDSVNSDDIDDTALLDMFNSIQNPQPTDYILFSVIGSVSNDGAWCATGADWYRNQYIQNYGMSVNLQSGNWNKWTSPDGVNWSATVNTAHTNYFGPGCDGVNGSWCSEWGINPNSLNLVITPAAVGAESYGDGWNTGNTTVTIRYGGVRFAVCGF